MSLQAEAEAWLIVRCEQDYSEIHIYLAKGWISNSTQWSVRQGPHTQLQVNKWGITSSSGQKDVDDTEIQIWELYSVVNTVTKRGKKG